MARDPFFCNLNDVETRDGIFQGKGFSEKVPSFLLPGVREGVVWCTDRREDGRMQKEGLLIIDSSTPELTVLQREQAQGLWAAHLRTGRTDWILFLGIRRELERGLREGKTVRRRQSLRILPPIGGICQADLRFPPRETILRRQCAA